MYEQDNDTHEEPTTLPMFPRRPAVDDTRWRDVAVRSRSQEQTNINRFPLEESGMQIATVYAGDTISIMPEVQHEYFVAARIGYRVGWINFRHVKLVSLARGRRMLEETKPDPPVDRNAHIAHRQWTQHEERQYQEPSQYQEAQGYQETQYQQADYVEQETQPAPPLERIPPPIERNDVKRIINKLKSLGGIFSRR